jgi:RimJ/RimL family protein N-acetyltransferase
MSSITRKTITARNGQLVTIRTAQPDDAAPLLAYVRSVAAETPFFIMEADEFDFSDEQERQWIQDHLDGPGTLVLLAEVSGEVVGSLSFENGPHRRIAHRGTFGFSVAKDWRGKGIGTALLQILIDWAKDNPLIEKIGMAVCANNERAIRVYRKLGFVEEGRRPREMKLGPGQYVDDILMYRFVKSPEFEAKPAA